MKATELRQSILQAAVQGKLVPQNPKDEPACELLGRIQKEKAHLIKERKIKKMPPLPEIAENEMPFEIPENWCWVRLGQLTELITSGSRDWAKYYAPTGDIFLRMGNLSRGKFDLRLDKIQHVKLPKDIEGIRTSVQAGDLLFSITGEIGTLGLIPDNFGTAYINQHTAMIRFVIYEKNKFYPYLLLSDYAQKFYNGNQHGIKNSFRLDTIALLPVPLPPLEEQHRIISKVDELFALCDELEAEEEKLDALEAHFTEYLPKAILQAAVQGKLVPPNPHDEPASELLKRIQQEKAQLVKEGKLKNEKPLPPISEDEIPYDLPEGWMWCRLGEITNVIMGQSPKGDSVSACKDGIEFHQGKTLFTDKYLALSTQKTNAPTKIAVANSVLLSVRAPVGAVNIIERDICIGRGLCGFNTFCFMKPHFLFYFLKSMERSFIEQATGTTFIAVTGEVVKKQLFPLPPLEEQQCIIAKVDELMTLCDELKVAYTIPVVPSSHNNIIPFPATQKEEETLLVARGDVGQLSNEAMQAIDDLFAEDEE